MAEPRHPGIDVLGLEFLGQALVVAPRRVWENWEALQDAPAARLNKSRLYSSIAWVGLDPIWKGQSNETIDGNTLQLVRWLMAKPHRHPDPTKVV